MNGAGIVLAGGLVVPALLGRGRAHPARRRPSAVAARHRDPAEAAAAAHAARGCAGAPGLIAGAALLVAIGTGGWIFYNTNILNDYQHRRTQARRYRRRI